MLKIVISDTSTLILFHKIDEFNLKQMSIIDNVKPLIDKLLLTDFRLADNIIEEILKLNNE